MKSGSSEAEARRISWFASVLQHTVALNPWHPVWAKNNSDNVDHHHEGSAALVPVPYWLLPALVCTVLLLTSQVFWGGLHVDDWHHREVLEGTYEFTNGASPYLEFFTFATGNPDENLQLIDRGVLPWWSDEQLRFMFLRPISVATHQIDSLLWPDQPGLAHFHSVLWFAACVYAASLVYRRCGVTTAGCSLAITFFALDDAHGTTIYWLANRNHLVAGTFALLAFNEHLKWQTLGSIAACCKAMLLFAVSLLSAELGAAYGGLVFAWAVFLHTGPLRQKIISILPGACVGIVWFAVYQTGGFGARFSGQYVDPAGDPAGFVFSITERIPLFFSVVFGIGATDLYSLGSQSVRPVMWLGSLAVCVFIFSLMTRYGRHDRHLKFWLLAALLSMLPICAGNLMDRIMLLATFTGHGLVSRFMELTAAAIADLKRNRPDSRHLLRLPTGIYIYFLLANIVGASALLPFRIFASDEHRKAIDTAVTTLDAAGAIDDADLIVVNPPDTMFTWHLAKIRRGFGQTVPRNVRVLCSALVPITLTRPDDRTVVIKPERPFIRSALSDLYRSTPLQSGWHRTLTGVDISIISATADGDPTEIEYRFDSPLEDEKFVWVQWQHDRFERLPLPAVGATVRIPAQITPLWIALNPIQSLFGHTPSHDQ